MPEERLQKILSQAGVTSRRKAEELIVEGRVSVNGKTVTELGSKADIDNDHIKVDGRPLRAPKHLTYIALNKPKECMTTVSDPEGRQTVMHLMRGVRERVFPVGRLDYHSEGLLLLTNDGEFAHRLTAPANHVTKTYVVKVNGALTEAQEKQFREGIPMHGRKTAPAELKRIKHGPNPWYEVKITEGRQNQIRIMFKHFGKLVEKLRRVKIGFLELDVAPARYRSLTAQEVEKFRRVLKLEGTAEGHPKPHQTADPAEAHAAPAAKPKSPGVGPRSTGPRSTGPRNTGPRNAGTRSTEPRNTESRNAGPRNPEPRNAGTRSTGLRSTGPRNAEPRNAGPRNPEPRNAGTRGTGPRNASSRKRGPRNAGRQKPLNR